MINIKRKIVENKEKSHSIFSKCEEIFFYIGKYK